MATQTSTARRTVPPRPVVSQQQPLARFTVEQYHRMGAAGILDENSRCELIDGLIVEKPVIYPPHKNAVRRLSAQVHAVVGPGWVIDSQGPITLDTSEPEPDLTVSVGPDDRYTARHPGPIEVALLVEVSDSSLDYDRGEKLRMYAAARIPVYWIVNIPERVVEVYTQPRAGKSPTYRTRTDYPPGSDIPVVLRGTTAGTIPTSAVLPG